MLISIVALVLPHRADASEPRWTKSQLADIARLEHQVEPGASEFHIRTAHYDIRTEVDAAFTARAACYMELFREQAVQMLRIGNAPAPIAKLVVYASRERYQKAIKADSKSRGWFYWSSQDDPDGTLRTFIEFPRERDFQAFPVAILTHEGTHQLLHLRGGPNARLPHLFDEGLATYLQTWDFFATAERNLKDHRLENGPTLGQSLRAGTVPTLAELVVAEPWDVDAFGPRTITRYACAASLIDFMLSTDGGKKRLLSWLEDCFAGKDIAPVFTGDGGVAIESAWRQHLQTLAKRWGG